MEENFRKTGWSHEKFSICASGNSLNLLYHVTGFVTSNTNPNGTIMGRGNHPYLSDVVDKIRRAYCEFSELSDNHTISLDFRPSRVPNRRFLNADEIETIRRGLRDICKTMERKCQQ